MSKKVSAGVKRLMDSIENLCGAVDEQQRASNGQFGSGGGGSSSGGGPSSGGGDHEKPSTVWARSKSAREGVAGLKMLPAAHNDFINKAAGNMAGATHGEIKKAAQAMHSAFSIKPKKGAAPVTNHVEATKMVKEAAPHLNDGDARTISVAGVGKKLDADSLKKMATELGKHVK